MFDLKEELKKLPNSPGVYIMKNSDDCVIYVGKAKILKNRVRQYFQNSTNHSIKVKKMVSNIASFEYIITDTEVEALILENNLIKKYSPKYNIMLKDDKTYPYIKITTNDMFPRMFITRKHDKDKARYFGPYTSSQTIKETFEIILKIWPIRRCLKKFPRDFNKERPCLNYHIGQCLAPCSGNIDQHEYRKMIDEIIDFLSGKHENIIKQLENQMKIHSDNLMFEKAAEIRDKINAIKKINERQVIENMSMQDKDIIGFARAGHEAIFQIFFVRGGKIIGREHFMLNNADDFSRKEIASNFIKQFYSGTPYIPKEIVINEDIEDAELICRWLSDLKNQKVIITFPKRGEKLKLLELAEKNAILILDKFGENIKREQRKTIGALNEIKEALGVDFDLKRIEAYDISNIQGVQPVASMVVFENGKPKKSDYKKFKIRTVFGANDYASINEVITRRFSRYKKEFEQFGNSDIGKFNKLPSIIFIDGGKGQMSSAIKALEDIGINVPVCGMVKDDNHRTRGIIFEQNEINIPHNSEGFKLITRIQDEVHRFAIEYHRKLHRENQMHSILDDIPGIGEKRKKAILKHFSSIENIKKATVDEIASIDGMNIKAAQNVIDFFNR